MNLQKHQLYLFEQHSESFKVWWAIIRINTEGKSLIMQLGPDSLIITPPHLLAALVAIVLPLTTLQANQ